MFKKSKADVLIKKKDLSKEQLLYYNAFSEKPIESLDNFFKESSIFQEEYAPAINLYYQNRRYIWGYKGLHYTELIEQDRYRLVMRSDLINDNTKGRISYMHFKASMTLKILRQDPEMYMKGLECCAERAPQDVIEYVVLSEDVALFALLLKASPAYAFTLSSARIIQRSKNASFIEGVFLLAPKKTGRWLGYAFRGTHMNNRTTIVSGDFLLKMIEGNPRCIVRIPKSFITYEMALAAVTRSGTLFSAIEKKHKTQELCNAASTSAVSCTNLIPKEMRNKGIIMKKVLEGKNALKYLK